MKATSPVLLGICLAFGLAGELTFAASERSDIAKWRGHMATLSKVLIDGFPFLYSSSEFKDAKNKARILSSLERLSNALHEMPSQSGQSLAGVAPLIGNAQLNMKGDLEEATRLYKQGDYEPAQKKIHTAVQKCFACHTVQQGGQRFPTTNQEVVRMATPLVFGKATVFGALRQFDGALDLIEKKGFARIHRESVTSDDLVKLHLVVSLRTKQDFARAQAFLVRLREIAPTSEVLGAWMTDVESWKKLAGQNVEKIEAYVTKRKKEVSVGEEGLFIVHLLESSVLHNKPIMSTTPNAEKAENYRRLSESYQGLRFSGLSDLPGIYSKAAESVDSSAR